MKREIIDLFSELISYETTSDSESGKFPSTDTQISFGKILEVKLKEIGLENVNVDKYGYVTGELPTNCGDETTVGFISHMDTSPDCSGKNIKPMVIENYNGDIIERKGEKLSPEDFPSLKNYIGKTIICSDGTTLLGSDDKAGVTEILTAVKFLVENPNIKHCNVKVAFTPDEEIGAGVDYFDVEKFKCDYAYTVDGGALGELEYENFNAAKAVIHVTGRSVHPGDAKDKMKNAAVMAMEFHSELPKQACPERTSGYEGFFHLTDMHGSVEAAQLSYIIRDHDREKFEKKKQLVESICSKLNERHGGAFFAAEITDQYYNMKEKIEPYLFLIENVKTCMKKLDIEPHIQPIRGGTDGARLSFMGIPCPNLCAGGHNFHGRYEYCCVESMEKITQLLILLAQK